MVSKLKDSRKLNIWYSEDEFFDYGVAKYVGSSAALVYFALCRHADRDGKAFPSVQLLMQECGLSNKIVGNSTRVLKKIGLIDIERHKNQHNVYYIKSVKSVISLNKWEKIASAKSTFAKKHPETQVKSMPEQVKNLHEASVESTPEQVKNLHEASVESTPEQVKNLHEASVESTQKGLPIEGPPIEGLLIEGIKKEHTHTINSGSEGAPKIENVCVYTSLNNFEQTAWNWAKAHNFWKSRITTIEQLRKNLAEGQSFRIQFEEASTPVPSTPQKQTSNNHPKVNGNPILATQQNAKVRSQITIKNCPYCNERGLVKFVDKQTGRFEDLPCPHDAQAIQQYAIQKNAKIETAQPDYQDPIKPSTEGTTRTDGLQSIRKILSARDDDVPF